VGQPGVGGLLQAPHPRRGRVRTPEELNDRQHQTGLDPPGRHHQDDSAAGCGGDRIQLRQLLIWSRATGDVTDPLTLMEVGPAAFEEIDPATGGVGNTGPPAAA
jgi:hypothetical protein